jgi:hypothetical protein
MFRVILRSLKAPDEIIVLENGIKSREFAETVRRNWRRVLGNKNWTIDRRPGLDTLDHLGLKIEKESSPC